MPYNSKTNWLKSKTTTELNWHYKKYKSKQTSNWQYSMLDVLHLLSGMAELNMIYRIFFFFF